MLFTLPFDYCLAMAGWLLGLCVLFFALLWLRRGWRERKPGRLTWLNLGLSLWMFLAALTALELYFAVIYDQSDSFNMTNVSKHWFARHVEPFQKALRFKDGTGTVYRDDHAFPETLQAGQRHICFVGDSFTFGHGVPEVANRFSNRVGASLEKSHPGMFVVSNLADAGRDLHWVEALTEEIITDKLLVDVLVYVLCLNDIETFDDRTSELYDELAAKAPQSRLVRDTYFPNLLYYRIQQARSARVGGYYSFLEDAYAGRSWDKMRAKLDTVRQMCADNGIDLRIVVFPFLHNLGEKYPFDVAHERIAEFCKEAGVPLLDLKPVLTAHVKEGLTVNRFDAHPNERAHELAAEAIEASLLHDVIERPQPTRQPAQ